MGILQVQLMDEDGNTLEEVTDREDRLSRLLPEEDDESFPCLRFIDPYGDTLFNTLQARSIVNELERLKARTQDPSDRELLEAIGQLSERCRDGVHLYIKFFGD